MVIGVNARLLLYGKMEGIGRFSDQVLKRLVLDNPQHEFVFFFDRPYHTSFIYANNVKPVVVFPPARHPLLFYIWFELRLPKLLSKYKVDIFFSPDGYLSLRSKTSQVQVVHDLAFEHFPEYVDRWSAWHYRYFFPKYCNKAKIIISVSESTKQDIIRKYQISADKIKVACNAASEGYQPVPVNEISKIRELMAGGNPYFLYTGAIHPRKNVVNLLLAFDRFRQRNPDQQFHLILAGRLAWQTESVENVLQKLTFRHQIHLTGHLQDQELSNITAAAHAMVYVSLFEGFGIPILESMQCGVPVITSNCSSMPEVAGNAALLVDPLSITEISEAMEKLAKDKIQWELCSQAGLERARLFTWERACEVVAEALGLNKK